MGNPKPETGAPSEGRIGIRDNADDGRWNREIVFTRGGACFRIVRMARAGAGGEMASAVSHALDLKRLMDFQDLHQLMFPPDRETALLCAMGSV